MWCDFFYPFIMWINKDFFIWRIYFYIIFRYSCPFINIDFWYREAFRVRLVTHAKITTSALFVLLTLFFFWIISKLIVLSNFQSVELTWNIISALMRTVSSNLSDVLWMFNLIFPCNIFYENEIKQIVSFASRLRKNNDYCSKFVKL